MRRHSLSAKSQVQCDVIGFMRRHRFSATSSLSCYVIFLAQRHRFYATSQVQCNVIGFMCCHRFGATSQVQCDVIGMKRMPKGEGQVLSTDSHCELFRNQGCRPWRAIQTNKQKASKNKKGHILFQLSQWQHWREQSFVQMSQLCAARDHSNSQERSVRLKS